MDKMPLIAVIFQSIPESIIIFSLGLSLMGVRLQWKKVIVAAIFSSLISYYVRGLPLPYGLHTIVGVFVVFIIMKFYFNVSYLTSLLSALIGIVTIVVMDTIYWPIVLVLIGMNINELWQSHILRLLLYIPELLLLSTLVFVIIKYKVKLVKN